MKYEHLQQLHDIIIFLMGTAFALITIAFT
jgi:hypothetical protein